MAPSSSDSPGSSQNQSITEVVIRLVATHIFGTCLYGHFGTLSNIPQRIHFMNVVGFLFNPAFIAAQLALGIFHATKYYYHHRGSQNPAGLQFYLDGIVGVWARHPNELDSISDITQTDPSPRMQEIYRSWGRLPILEVGHSRLRRTTEPGQISWASLGRLFVCLFLIAQSIGTSVIFIRRQKRGCTLAIDMAIGIMALASSVVGILVLYLQVMRTHWVILATSQRGLPRPVTQLAQEYDLKRLSWIISLIVASVVAAPIRGSPAIPLMFNDRFIVLLYSPWWLMSALSLLLPVLRHGGGRIGEMALSMWKNRWIRSLIVSALTCVVLHESVLYVGLAVRGLLDSKEGCWKDPLSDILFVI
ncbi:hypothetical protein V8F20_006632 [Naviculisporaceae sp. PSN 640]